MMPTPIGKIEKFWWIMAVLGDPVDSVPLIAHLQFDIHEYRNHQ